MHAISFLYWILGAFEAGNLKSIDKNSNTSKIVLDHITLVENLNEFIDLRTKNSIDLVLQIKGALTFNGLDHDNIVQLTSNLKIVIDQYHNKPQTCTAYYLQGAFELAKIDNINLKAIMFSDFPECDLLNKINFLFEINGNNVFTKQMKINLKKYVNKIFIHVIDVSNYTQKVESLVKKSKLGPINPENKKSNSKLDILC